jgi:hypothetical protein
MGIITRIRLASQVLFCVPQVGEGETTSPEVVRIASKGLARPMALTAKEIRTVCASALTQAPNRGK